jgi:hypothetical protein
VVGNTLEVAAQQYFLFKAWEVWGQQYGKVFKWFWGPQPVVTVRGGCTFGVASVNLCSSFAAAAAAEAAAAAAAQAAVT